MNSNISNLHEEFMQNLKIECPNNPFNDAIREKSLQPESMVRALRSDCNNDNIQHDQLDHEGHLDR